MNRAKRRMLADAVRGIFPLLVDPEPVVPEAAGGTAPPQSAVSAAAAPVVAGVEPAVADQRKFLEENTEDGKTEDGKKKIAAYSEEDVKKMHGALKKTLAETAAKEFDGMRKYLAEKGKKAEDVAKLSEADLRKEFDAAKKAEAGKPIEYTPFKLPDGVKVDGDLQKEFMAISAKHKLPQEAAQEFVDFYSKRVQEVAKAPYDLWKKTQEGWIAEMKKDPEIGGADYEKNLGFSAKAIDMISGDPKVAHAFRLALDYTGAGNNPEITRFLVRVGKTLGEGEVVLPGAGVTPDEKDHAKIMYPNQT